MQVQKLTRHLILALAAASAAYLGVARAQNADLTPSYVDGIAAVVNQDVITLRMVQNEIEVVTKNLKAQKIPIPEQSVLQKQVLQRLIDERLLKQEAAQLNITADNVNVDEAATMIAARNNLSVPQLRKEVEKSGLAWDTYLDGLRQEVVMDQIRQRVIDPRIRISESEIDAYLKSQGFDPESTKMAVQPNEMIELAQILVRVPEGASAARLAELKKKAESLLQQARQGADFAGLAASSSDGPEALQGGVMGTRPLGGWPDAFAQAIQNVGQGKVADLVRSGAGYHILKVVNRGQSQATQAAGTDMIVTQTHARHILIKFNQITSDEQAKQRIEQLALRLKNGEDFESLARAYSDDASAPQGGDLGWLHPGETVPAFENAMDALAIGQVSAPVRSQFGWHLIRVEERRDRNVGNEYRRLEARQALHAQRVEPAFDDWFSQIRSQAFIDNRLDPESSSRRRK